MAHHSFEIPSVDDLDHLPVEVVPTDELGVLTVRARAEDGDQVTLTCDFFARAFTIRWETSGFDRLRIERELATQVTVTDERGAVVLRCHARGADLGGTLVVRIAETVTVADEILHVREVEAGT